MTIRPYKVLCISMYVPDVERMDEIVEELKGRGMTGANRSALLRYALSIVDPDKVPRETMKTGRAREGGQQWLAQK